MYKIIKTKLYDFKLENETVFLRVDLNVPITKDGTIESDFRIKAIIPTLDLLINKKSKIILATHIGEPKIHPLSCLSSTNRRLNTDESNGYRPDDHQATNGDRHDNPKLYTIENLSTKLLIPWFQKHGYNIYFKETIKEAQSFLEKIKPGEIILLENLRFYKEETPNYRKALICNKVNDRDECLGVSHNEFEDEFSIRSREKFALKLHNLAKYYVNDAFGVSHREDTSITLLPQLYEKNKKTVGLLIEEELTVLSKLAKNPKKPFVLILGGVKAKTKIPLIKGLIDKIDILLLCPAISSTFVKALNKPIGKSLIETDLVKKAQEIVDLANKQKINVILPVDYLIATNNLAGPTSTIEAKDFPANGIAITIGPETLKIYKSYIDQAQTIFLNGAVGFSDQPKTYEPFISLLQAIAQSTALSVIGGGESVAAVFKYGFEKAINFCSTGGGATLAYLSGKTLPGLKYLDNML